MRKTGAHRPTVPVGTGAFAGRREPQAADLAGAEELVDSMLGAGGLRVALTSARNRVFRGADLSPQTFIAAPSHPNDATSLEAAPAAGSANYRRMVNRHRGRSTIA